MVRRISSPRWAPLIALLVVVACGTPARRVALEPVPSTSSQPSSDRLDMPSCPPGDTIGLAIPDYAGNPANDDAPAVTPYSTAQQALRAELADAAPRLSPDRFDETYSGGASFAGGRHVQYAFIVDGRPGILIDVEGSSTWRVLRTASCTSVIDRYR